MKIVCLVQARLGSTRLPGKVLMDVAGKPMLRRVLERAAAIPWLGECVVVAPRCDADAIRAAVPLANVHSGSPIDVLDRYAEAASILAADVVLRVTGDCPLLAPEFSGEVLGRLVGSGADYAHNVGPSTDGLDTQAFTAKALFASWREASDPDALEHPGLFFLRDGTRFRREHVLPPDWWPGPKLSVDTAEDLERVRAVYCHLREGEFSLKATFEALGKAGIS